MKKNVCFFIAISALCLLSCRKTTTIEGTVYSRNNVPVPYADVSVQVYEGKDYPDHQANVVSADSNGKFVIRFKERHHRGYKLHCVSDSGTCESKMFYKDPDKVMDLFLK